MLPLPCPLRSPAGTYSPDLASTNCISCPGGTYSIAGVSACKAW